VRAILGLKTKLEGAASHDDIYDRACYANYAEEMDKPAKVMVASIVTSSRGTFEARGRSLMAQ
jgi:hypothetical protein